MTKQNPLSNEQGFTLVEIIAVLIILGILAAVAVPRYIDLETSAKARGLDAAVAELNGRESLTWANVKISATTTGPIDDAVTGQMGANNLYDLGDEYSWTSGPGGGSGELQFKGATITVSRRKASPTSPGTWVKKSSP